jgi:2-oxo-4-hydroxy-4-carboxy-5-ureidoimidazoline decarboxylase
MTAPRLTLDHLNAASATDFVAALGEIFEHAPWVAEAAAARRPYATVTALHAAMQDAVDAADEASKIAFLRGHPELGGKVARAGAMADASKQEQGALGLDRLSDDEFARFETLNAAYRARFGFPFIICVRRHTRDSILDRFEGRLAHSGPEELAAALAEIGHITRLRLADRVEGPGAPKVHGRLSTHVLDVATGKPAAGIRTVLKEVGRSATSVLKETRTNHDGRTDEPLIGGAPLRIGRYELEFHVGDYFAAGASNAASPPFLDVVPIRFAIAEPEAHYHVPLLVSPWSYSTYRGS